MLNKIILMGRITKDLELKYTSTNVPFCNFSIAVDRNFASPTGQRETDFFNIVAWRRNAEFICKYFSKGGLICLDGNLQNRTWESADGSKRYWTEVHVDAVYFCGSRQTSQMSNDPSFEPIESAFEEANKITYEFASLNKGDPNSIENPKNIEKDPDLEELEDDDMPF